MKQETVRLTGTQAGVNRFHFEETDELDPELVIDVLQGRRLGIIFRDVIPRGIQERLTAKFWASPARRHRTGEPSHCVGSYHWNKSSDTYLAETEQVRAHVHDLLDVPNSPWKEFRLRLAGQLARRDAVLRSAAMQGMEACPALIRAWDREGQFSLQPHEDRAQCADPRQAGFEIQQVSGYEVCAVNMCVEHEEGGRLVVWNIRPDDESRRRLGVEYTGFPYPEDALADFDELRIGVQRGDIYVFNGSFVHAVDAVKGNRTNVSFLMGFIDEQTVVTWT
jgi:hypothetical protein